MKNNQEEKNLIFEIFLLLIDDPHTYIYFSMCSMFTIYDHIEDTRPRINITYMSTSDYIHLNMTKHPHVVQVCRTHIKRS